jgi:hypothetical protein
LWRFSEVRCHGYSSRDQNEKGTYIENADTHCWEDELPGLWWVTGAREAGEWRARTS